jgi:hypothetical protein
MNGLGTIAWGAGLQDGLNPCIFMTCAVFIIHSLWLKRRSLKSGWLRIIFALVYASSSLEFNFGPAQIFLFHKNFIFAVKIFYFVLGVGAFITGILFLKDWFLLHRGVPAKDECPLPKAGGQGKGSWGVLLTTVLLGLVLSALATLWPVNNYIMLLGNETILKGQWQAVMPLLLGYVFTSMWPLWFVWAFLSIKNLRPSLLKIVCSSIFLTASSCVIFIFK